MMITEISGFTRINTSLTAQNFGKKKSDITDYKLVEDTIEEIEKKLALESQHLKNMHVQAQFGSNGDCTNLEEICTEITNKIEKLKTRLEKYTRMKNKLEEKLGLTTK